MQSPSATETAADDTSADRASATGTALAFARAVAAQDWRALLDLLAPDVDFHGLTPRRAWTAPDAAGVVDDVILGAWFVPGEDVVEDLVGVAVAPVGARIRVGYRLRVSTPDGPHVVEQQAYLQAHDGRIGWLRILCSGFQPGR